MKYNLHKKKGFALVELVIVFVIIVLLGVMLVPIFKKLSEHHSGGVPKASESQEPQSSY
jgi:competence protein ComGC